ncbi:hypothetical protein GQ457_01G017350 [Hibiscus cannabinus]
MVLLSFSSVEVRDSVLAATVVWSTWFSRLEVWTPGVTHESRRAWLSNSGLPIHLWSDGTFRNIAGHWGSYLLVDAATEEPFSFERARVLIVTSFPGRIDEVVQVIVQDNVYSIVIQEVELVRIPVVEQPVRTGGSDGDGGKKARSLYVAVGNFGESDALTCFGGGRRGVCSVDDVRVAWAGDRSRDIVEVKSTPDSSANRESPLGFLEGVTASSKTIVANNDLLHSPVALGSVGSSGGIVLLWEGSRFVADSSIVERNYVVVQGRWISEGCVCSVVAVSAPSNLDEQAIMLSELARVINSVSMPVCVGCEFNMVRWPSERSSLPRGISDHSPLSLSNDDRDWGSRPFRFLNCWLDSVANVRCFSSEWRQLAGEGIGMGNVFVRLRQMKVFLRKLNKEEFRDVDMIIEDMQRRIDGVDEGVSCGGANFESIGNQRQWT